MAIDELRRRFESAFGIPLGVVPMPCDLIQIFPGRLLWGSAISKQEPLLTQSDIEAFLKGSRAGYFLIGFWGQGSVLRVVDSMGSGDYQVIRAEGRRRRCRRSLFLRSDFDQELNFDAYLEDAELRSST